jgi:hypothetical protein
VDDADDVPTSVPTYEIAHESDLMLVDLDVHVMAALVVILRASPAR